MTRSVRHNTLKIQPRDLLVLGGLLDSRVLLLKHIAALFFDGRVDAAKKRVHRLKAAGLIRERPRGPRERSVLHLAKAGFEILQQQHALPDDRRLIWLSLLRRMQVSVLTVAHELEVADVRAALCAAIAKTHTLRVTMFSTWPAHHRFSILEPATGERCTVEPDGYIGVAQERADGRRRDHSFFLEVDRSTESVERVVRQVGRYRTYYTSGGFAKRNGCPPDDYTRHPFRVLLVLKSAARRDHVARALLELSPPVLSQAWLTTHAEITASPLAEIWIEPRSFRNESGETPAKRRLFDEPS